MLAFLGGCGAGRLIMGVNFTPASIKSNITGVDVRCTGDGVTSPSGEAVGARSSLLCILVGVVPVKDDVAGGPGDGSKFSLLTPPGGTVAPGVRNPST